VVICLTDHGYPTATAFVPDTGDLAALARAALGRQDLQVASALLANGH
jgi:hypothetical protein